MITTYLIDVLLNNLKSIINRSNDDMFDMSGRWLDDITDIERDLGMPIKEFDELMDMKNSLVILQNEGQKTVNNYSIREKALIIKHKLYKVN